MVERKSNGTKWTLVVVSSLLSITTGIWYRYFRDTTALNNQSYPLSDIQIINSLPVTNAKVDVSSFVRKLRALSGGKAVDCGFQTKDQDHRVSRCMAKAFKNGKAFRALQKGRNHFSAANFGQENGFLKGYVYLPKKGLYLLVRSPLGQVSKSLCSDPHLGKRIRYGKEEDVLEFGSCIDVHE